MKSSKYADILDHSYCPNAFINTITGIVFPQNIFDKNDHKQTITNHINIVKNVLDLIPSSFIDYFVLQYYNGSDEYLNDPMYPYNRFGTPLLKYYNDSFVSFINSFLTEEELTDVEKNFKKQNGRYIRRFNGFHNTSI